MNKTTKNGADISSREEISAVAQTLSVPTINEEPPLMTRVPKLAKYTFNVAPKLLLLKRKRKENVLCALQGEKDKILKQLHVGFYRLHHQHYGTSEKADVGDPCAETPCRVAN